MPSGVTDLWVRAGRSQLGLGSMSTFCRCDFFMSVTAVTPLRDRHQLGKLRSRILLLWFAVPGL